MVSNNKLSTLPTAPGIYMFKDKSGDVLYVGKAKLLKTRVRSYFRANSTLDTYKRQMIPKIDNIETIVTDTENEALILEANLIRKHKPPYNIVLTDDKYYLFIKITNEDMPRVFPVRRINRDKSRYFGPYSSARSVRQTLKLLRRLFPYLDEKANPDQWVFPHPLFTSDAKGARRSAAQRYEVAQITNSRTLYQDNINSIIRFLKGDRQKIIKTLQQGMKNAANDKHYEQAAIFRDQLSVISRLEGEQKVHLPGKQSFDVISVVTDKTKSAANVFAVRAGKVLGKNTFLLRHRSAAPLSDVVRQFLLQYYRDINLINEKEQEKPKIIFVPKALSDSESIAKWINASSPPAFIVPKRGLKRQLMQMGELNAQEFLKSELALFEQDEQGRKATRALSVTLQIGDLELERIETYDISNIQGRLPTGSMVVFTDGVADRSGYRTFKIQMEDSPNDTAMIKEVLLRRFSGRHQNWKKPDLILIDGGIAQLNAAKATLTKLDIKIPIAALAKREEELFIPGQKTSIRLPYDSDAMYLLQRMRDEAHRVTLRYHRLLRSKRSSRSLLDEIPGIGPKTKRKLLHHFGSLKQIRAANDDDLEKVIGNKARILRQYL